MKKLTAIIAGYGKRGAAYAKYAMQYPDQLEIVAVADPLECRRQTAKERHGLADTRLFTDWKELAQRPKMADFVIIATQDNMHYEPALAFIEKGYDLLLEKPMAPTARECKAIAAAADEKGVKVLVCHVLRYTRFWRHVKDIVDDGRLGELMSVVHMENVGNRHQSHSFVRGNWRNKAESAPMILAKSCHDMDLLQWLIGKPCTKVQSFGELTHFRPENKPKGAPARCVEGCPAADTCLYNAVKLYYDDKKNSWFRSVAADTIENPTDEQVMQALVGGPYGRCVYACDNDVVDHQVVNMVFEGGCTVSFTMNAFNEGGRFIRIFGTKGELIGDMEHNTLHFYDFATKETTHYTGEQICGDLTGGHGGGDTGIMRALIPYFGGETPDKSISTATTSYLNHLIAFAAEDARIDERIIDFDRYAAAL